MKNLIIIISMCFFLGAHTIAAQQSVEKCFEADRRSDELRQDDRHEIRMTINGEKVSGFYYIEPPTGAGDTQYFRFAGTRVGNTLNVRFEEKTPDSLTIFGDFKWSLASSAGQEYAAIDLFKQSIGKQLLKIDLYKQSPRKLAGTQFYFPCHTMWARTAKQIRFAKGASSAQILKPFKATGEKAYFLLNVKKGQYVGAVAFGCSVEIHFPNGDVFAYVEPAGEERDTTSSLDSLGTDLPAPSSGDVLFVLTKAGESSVPEKATFIVADTQKDLDEKIGEFFKTK